MTPRTGLIITDRLKRHYSEHIRSLRFPTHSNEGLPKSYKTPVADVQDQGDCGSCVAFGTTAAIEGSLAVSRKAYMKMADPNSFKLSELDLFSNGGTCADGWALEDADQAAQTKGIVAEAMWPYNGAKQPGYDTAPRTRTLGSERISSDAEAKQWLFTHGPLQAAMDVYGDLFAYKGGVYTPDLTFGDQGSHCVCICGYDDEAGCWICKNSWGTGWGEAGFFRIAYGQCGILRDYVAFGQKV